MNCLSPAASPSRGLLLATLLGLATGPGLLAADAVLDPAPFDVTEVATAPTETITLYDGKTVTDLSRFYTWLQATGYDDPLRVFTVVDRVEGGPAIRISGQGYGGLVTRGNYRDYRLVFEYRWGAVTWGARRDRTRNSGVLFHCQGEDGNHVPSFASAWIQSIEYEVQEGRTGTMILVDGYDRGSPQPVRPSVVMRSRADDIWDPAGEPSRHEAFKFLFHSTYDTGWKDVLGFRNPRDADRPVGEWNRGEIVARGDALTFIINGRTVMEATESSVREGRLLFQTEGAEIFYRLIELHPLAP
jgi:hypothetical protein